MSLGEWLLYGWILLMGWLMWQALYWTGWLAVMLYVWLFRGSATAIRAGVRVAKANRATVGRRP